MVQRSLLPVIGIAYLSALSANGVLACSGPVAYKTVISTADTTNSSGQNLQNLGVVIRQDRANYHKFMRRDTGDEPDSLFADQDMRLKLEQAVNRAHPQGTDFDPGDGYMMLEEILQSLEFGAHVAVSFDDCEDPARANVNVMGFYKPSIPHPGFDEAQPPEGELEALPPPPQ